MRPRPRSDPKSIDLDQLVIAAGKLAKTVRNKGGTAMARIVMKPSPGRRGEISEVTEKEVEMDRISRIQWRALSRRAVVVRSLACAAGAAASLAPVEEASAKMAQKAINSAATAIYSRSRMPARWSTVKSVRRDGVNSGSKRLVKPGRLRQPDAKHSVSSRSRRGSHGRVFLRTRITSPF